MLCPHLLFPLSQCGHFRPLLIPQNTDDAHTSLLSSSRGWVTAWYSSLTLPHIHLNSSLSCPQAASSAFNVETIPFGRTASSSGCLFLSGCCYKASQVLISVPKYLPLALACESNRWKLIFDKVFLPHNDHFNGSNSLSSNEDGQSFLVLIRASLMASKGKIWPRALNVKVNKMDEGPQDTHQRPTGIR